MRGRPHRARQASRLVPSALCRDRRTHPSWHDSRAAVGCIGRYGLIWLRHSLAPCCYRVTCAPRGSVEVGPRKAIGRECTVDVVVGGWEGRSRLVIVRWRGPVPAPRPTPHATRCRWSPRVLIGNPIRLLRLHVGPAPEKKMHKVCWVLRSLNL